MAACLRWHNSLSLTFWDAGELPKASVWPHTESAARQSEEGRTIILLNADLSISQELW